MPGNPRDGEQVKITMVLKTRVGHRYKICFLDRPDVVQQVSENALSLQRLITSHLSYSPTESVVLTVKSLARLERFLREKLSDQKQLGRLHRGKDNLAAIAIQEQDETCVATADCNSLEGKLTGENR